MKILITKDGQTVTGLHDDNFPFSTLGDLEINRATDVRFDNQEKLWFVHDPKTGERIIPQGFVSRKLAILAEVIFLEKILEKGVT